MSTLGARHGLSMAKTETIAIAAEVENCQRQHSPLLRYFSSTDFLYF